MTETAPRKSDLGVRVVSAVVMVAVAGVALWLGGTPFVVFVTTVAIGVLWEWWGLVTRFRASLAARLSWLIAGIGYIGCAAYVLVDVRSESIAAPLLILLAVIAVDVGAYFAGRAIGGPRIAPKISPSKTWAGLAGGMVAAAGVCLLVTYVDYRAQFFGHNWEFFRWRWELGALGGALVAVIAQFGDFFESWMKRRAGVKDSGSLIPGHGGLFDRVDGLVAVLVAIALPSMLTGMLRGLGI